MRVTALHIFAKIYLFKLKLEFSIFLPHLLLKHFREICSILNFSRINPSSSCRNTKTTRCPFIHWHLLKPKWNKNETEITWILCRPCNQSDTVFNKFKSVVKTKTLSIPTMYSVILDVSNVNSGENFNMVFLFVISLFTQGNVL